MADYMDRCWLFDTYFGQSVCVSTVSAQLERRGSIFQSGFLVEVLFKFNIPGVLIEMGIY